MSSSWVRNEVYRSSDGTPLATSSFSTSQSSNHRPSIRKLNDAVYEFYRPPRGQINVEIIFFHGFHAESSGDAYFETWMAADQSTNWLNTWLVEAFPEARILSISYDSSIDVSESMGRTEMYVVGENLAQSIIGLEGIGQSCPVVFVGHCVGGLVLKEVCLKADQMGTRERSPESHRYLTFLRNLKGVFFYATPHSGSRTFSKMRRNHHGPLLDYMELLSKKTARINFEFAKLRRLHGWKTVGVSEANETNDCNTLVPNSISRLFRWKASSSLVVEEGSSRYDMDEFSVLSGEDNFTICRPKDRKSSNFLFLVNFVENVLKKEATEKEHLHRCVQLPRILVHMDERVATTIKTLRLGEDEPSRLAMVGMSGIGKSTLAKQVFMQIGLQFDFICFVEDITGRLKRESLQDLIAENLFFGGGRQVWLHDTQSLWGHLKGQKVLMIMDNVDSEAQISILLKSSWCANGSRLIITSCRQELIRGFTKYEVPFLSLGEAKRLFEAHVDDGVLEDIPTELIEQVVVQCDGLPLTLEVTGSFLRNQKDVCKWAGALERLRRAESLEGRANDRLWQKLRMSFDELGRPEQGMFLDLAVFDKCNPDAVYYDVNLLKAAWKTGVDGESLELGLDNLVESSFIRMKLLPETANYNAAPTEVGRKGLLVTVVIIHEQLRDMGRSIIRPPGEKVLELCRGLWHPNDVHSLLVEHKGDIHNAQTETLSVAFKENEAGSPVNRQTLKWKVLVRLEELRLLRMSNVTLTGCKNVRFPPKLTALHMISCSRVPRNKMWFLESNCWPIREEDVEGLHKLSVLLMEDCSSVRLPDTFHNLSNLRALKISSKHLSELPKDFGRLPSLERMSLECAQLRELPASILETQSLRNLRLKGCSALTNWPVQSVPKKFRSIVDTHLCNLVNLRLEELPLLTDLPESFGLLKSLRTLTLTKCSAMEKLPEGFGGLQQLMELSISDCGSLELLCDSLGKLRSLRKLEVEHCPQFSRLPDSIGCLQSLEYLVLVGGKLKSLPTSTGKLSRLTTLQLRECHSIERLPESIGELKALDGLHLKSNNSLESLPVSLSQLNAMETLVVTECHRCSFSELKDHDGFDSLKYFAIDMSERVNLETLPGIVGCLKSLSLLSLGNCGSIQLKGLPDRYQLEDLRSLDIPRSESFQRLRVALQQLRLEKFSDLQLHFDGAFINLDLTGGNAHQLIQM